MCADLTSLVHPFLMWREKRERGSSCYLFYKKTNLLFSGSNFLLHRVTLLSSTFPTGFCFATLVMKNHFRREEQEERGPRHDMLLIPFLSDVAVRVIYIIRVLHTPGHEEYPSIFSVRRTVAQIKATTKLRDFLCDRMNHFRERETQTTFSLCT